jgi:DNA-binding HxlR family transcriptional regulator
MVTLMKPMSEDAMSECRTVSDTLSRIGDKWSVLVIVHLGDGPQRFGELQKRIGNISQKMLSATVRGLERDGYLTRTVTPIIPPRVDYELTELGRELLDPIRGIETFARRNQHRIAAARKEFDARSG